MKILLYEFITGGGWHLIDPHAAPSGSLLAEGTAMRDALASDLVAIANCEVALLHDPRVPTPQAPAESIYHTHNVSSTSEHLPILLKAAAQCDATILIAPEFEGHLTRLALALEQAGTKLLSPASDFVRLTSDKHKTATHLAAANLPVPRGYLLDTLHRLETHLPPLPYPAVLKPNEGAGSLDISRIDQPGQISSSLTDIPRQWRWEELVPGQAASVAVLCGPTPLPCPACAQHISSDGKFTYLGGRRLEDARLAGRAESLARRTIAALPPTVGYVGIDLILGHAADGSADAVIEVNPRLTTSYVGLRELARENLAAAMLVVAEGKPPVLFWREGAIQFDSQGICH